MKKPRLAQTATEKAIVSGLGKMERNYFFDSDPRPSDKLWESHPGRWWFHMTELDREDMEVWLDCGYGMYAITCKGKLLATGKNSLHFGEFCFLSEYYGDENVGLYKKL